MLEDQNKKALFYLIHYITIIIIAKYISISNYEINTIKTGDYWLSKKFDGQLWFYCKSNKK